MIHHMLRESLVRHQSTFYTCGRVFPEEAHAPLVVRHLDGIFISLVNPMGL